MPAFGNNDTPGEVSRRKMSERYRVTNGYTGEVFDGLDGCDVDKLLRKWLCEWGYEWQENEQWYERRWVGFADGIDVEEAED